MSLLNAILEANSAVMEGGDVPVPAVPGGRSVVIVTCSEIRAPGRRDMAAYFGFTQGEAFVVTNAGARVHESEGDVARSVVCALAASGGGEVFVVAHENCRFLAADPESVAALVAAPNSAIVQAAEALSGPNFISARKLAITSAEMLRASPFVAARAVVHALLFAEGRGRLTSEQSGYGVAAAAPSSAPFAMGMSASPSPILSAHGSSGGIAPGPVSLFGSGPTSIMSTPPSFIAPPPELTGAAAFLAPASATFAEPPPPKLPPGFVVPTVPYVAPATDEPEPPPFEPLSFTPPPPPARQPKSPGAEDPFRRASETLERLRKQRRK